MRQPIIKSNKDKNLSGSEFFLLFLLTAILFTWIVYSIYFIRNVIIFYNVTEVAATVSSKERGDCGRRCSYHRIKYTYKDSKNNTYTNEDSLEKIIYYKYDIGDKITAYYSNKYPNKSYSKYSHTQSNIKGGLIVLLVGLFINLSIFTIFLKKIFYKIYSKKLKKSGIKTNAKIINIEPPEYFKTGYTKITYTWNDIKGNQQFNAVYYKNVELINIEVGDEIEILISHENPEISYWEPKLN